MFVESEYKFTQFVDTRFLFSMYLGDALDRLRELDPQGRFEARRFRLLIMLL